MASGSSNFLSWSPRSPSVPSRRNPPTAFRRLKTAPRPLSSSATISRLGWSVLALKVRPPCLPPPHLPSQTTSPESNSHWRLLSVPTLNWADLADGNLMLVLGLLWSSFRKLSLGSIGDSLEQAEGKAGAKKGKPEDDLLKWIGELTKDYDVPVTSFKERLQTAPPSTTPAPPLSSSYLPNPFPPPPPPPASTTAWRGLRSLIASIPTSWTLPPPAG